MYPVEELSFFNKAATAQYRAMDDQGHLEEREMTFVNGTLVEIDWFWNSRRRLMCSVLRVLFLEIYLLPRHNDTQRSIHHSTILLFFPSDTSSQTMMLNYSPLAFATPSNFWVKSWFVSSFVSQAFRNRVQSQRLRDRWLHDSNLSSQLAMTIVERASVRNIVMIAFVCMMMVLGCGLLVLSEGFVGVKFWGLSEWSCVRIERIRRVLCSMKADSQLINSMLDGCLLFALPWSIFVLSCPMFCWVATGTCVLYVYWQTAHTSHRPFETAKTWHWVKAIDNCRCQEVTDR